MKTQFYQKKWEENAGFYKPALNKIMTTHEYLKYNFVAPLKYHFLTSKPIDHKDLNPDKGAHIEHTIV